MPHYLKAGSTQITHGTYCIFLEPSYSIVILEEYKNVSWQNNAVN